MNLFDAQTGKKYRILSINLQQSLNERVLNLGIYVGARVQIVKSATKSAPVLINCQGLNVALGQGISKKIEVLDSE